MKKFIKLHDYLIPIYAFMGMLFGIALISLITCDGKSRVSKDSLAKQVDSSLVVTQQNKK